MLSRDNPGCGERADGGRQDPCSGEILIQEARAPRLRRSSKSTRCELVPLQSSASSSRSLLRRGISADEAVFSCRTWIVDWVAGG
jgi:hypothetical protein